MTIGRPKKRLAPPLTMLLLLAMLCSMRAQRSGDLNVEIRTGCEASEAIGIFTALRDGKVLPVPRRVRATDDLRFSVKVAPSS